MLYVDCIVPVDMMANHPPPMAKSISFHFSKRKPDRKSTSSYRIIALAFCSFHRGVFIRRIVQSPANSPTDCSLSVRLASNPLMLYLISFLYYILFFCIQIPIYPSQELHCLLDFAFAHPALRIVFIPGLGRRLHLRQSFNLTTTNYPAFRFARNTTDTFSRGKSLFNLYHYCHYYILFHFGSLLESLSPYSPPTGAATASAIPGFSDKASLPDRHSSTPKSQLARCLM